MRSRLTQWKQCANILRALVLEVNELPHCDELGPMYSAMEILRDAIRSGYNETYKEEMNVLRTLKGLRTSTNACEEEA